MGTMGAVIFQGRGTATRKQMFDIAVSGPLAGLLITIPVLWFGIKTSGYVPKPPVSGLEFGEPLLVKWMMNALHGSEHVGKVFVLNNLGFAGWVGVLITAMNLLPVGQLDGGHILYTLIGKPAHYVAYGVIGLAIAFMVWQQNFSFSLLLLLLLMTGPKHPPTANDNEPIGFARHLVGWATLSFYSSDSLQIRSSYLKHPLNNRSRRSCQRQSSPTRGCLDVTSLRKKRHSQHERAAAFPRAHPEWLIHRGDANCSLRKQCRPVNLSYRFSTAFRKSSDAFFTSSFSLNRVEVVRRSMVMASLPLVDLFTRGVRFQDRVLVQSKLRLFGAEAHPLNLGWFSFPAFSDRLRELQFVHIKSQLVAGFREKNV